MPSPAASVASSTCTSGSCLNDSCAFSRSSRPMPPWIMTTASWRPSSVVMRLLEVVEGVAVLGEDDQLLARRRDRRRDGAGAVRDAFGSPIRPLRPAGVKISPSRLASSRHFVSSPLRRTLERQRLQALQGVDLGLQLGDACGPRWPGRGSPPRRPRPRRPGPLPGPRRPRRPAPGRSGDGSRRDLAAALQQLQLAQAAFQPLPPAAQRLVDRLGRGGQAALQDGQREADRAGALVVLQAPRRG